MDCGPVGKADSSSGALFGQGCGMVGMVEVLLRWTCEKTDVEEEE